ncbi:MAG: hypothetical protein AAF665_09315 [Pseudomonadota bacterium]
MRQKLNEKLFKDTPIWLATGLPVLTYLAHFGFGSMGPEFYDAYIEHEFGVTEVATLFVLSFAIVLCIASLKLVRCLRDSLITGWLTVFLVGAVYFLGEEASWGQHLFGWQTPESWAMGNDQKETNLHNTGGVIGSLLDQIPRAVLTLSALVLGFAYPVWRYIRQTPLDPSTRWFWLLPTPACIAVGLLAPFASVPGKLIEDPPPALNLIYGEIKELLLAQFLLIYILSFWTRIRQAAGFDPAKATVSNKGFQPNAGQSRER